MEAGILRAFMRASAVMRKKMEKEREKGKEGTSSLAPKVIGKGVPKRKAEGKDDRPSKKVIVTLNDKQSKKLSPLKPRVEKGLMMAKGLVTQGPRRLFMHKGYAVKMVESVIKEMDLDPCTEQETEDLGASGLFDLSRVRFALPKLF